MKIFEFLLTNWDSALVVLAFIAVCVVLIKKGATKFVKQMLFYLVMKAEEQFGNGTGDLKYAAVATWVYERLPAVVKVFFTMSQLDKLIETAVADMKEYLESNENASALLEAAQSLVSSAGTAEDAQT